MSKIDKMSQMDLIEILAGVACGLVSFLGLALIAGAVG